jgi:hypothetical protein
MRCDYTLSVHYILISEPLYMHKHDHLSTRHIEGTWISQLLRSCKETTLLHTAKQFYEFAAWLDQ